MAVPFETTSFIAAPEVTMTPHLLVISIGPVQDFIASARRTRDLWFGSWLLSEVSKAVAHSLNSQHPGCLIFPSPNNPNTDLSPDSDLSVANVILAMPQADPRDLQTLLSSLKEQAKQRLLQLASDALNKNFFRQWPHQKPIVEAQLNDLLEFYWVAVKCPEDGYKNHRVKLYSLLAARKNTRTFVQPSWSSHAPKSSLDGLRESVLPQQPTVQQRAMLGVRLGEELCGVGLLKRLGARINEKRFASTSQIAAGPLLERVKASAKNYEALQQYLESLEGLRTADTYTELGAISLPKGEIKIDGACLYENRLAEYLGLDETTSDNPNLVKAKELLKQLMKSLRTSSETALEALPYYALYHADGDSMGEAIDHHSDDPDKHRAISQALVKFATQVPVVIEGFGGVTVYAGGEDILALLPLHTALQCAHQLSKDFKEAMANFKYNINKQPTLSAGLVIAHHLEPLEDALRLVREAEKQAKSVYGKDALAITLSKRSGSDFSVKGKTDVIAERLQLFTLWHYQDRFSDGTAYKLEAMYLQLMDAELTAKDEELNDSQVKRKYQLEQLLHHEAKRILGRGKINQDPQHIEQLMAYLANGGPIRDDSDPSISVHDLAKELILARLLAQAKQQAEGKYPNRTVGK